jgi:hypothetical protein
MPRGPEAAHKVIISGTGRSGTTFLVRLLTELGLDTGINKANWDKKYFAHSNAGLEHNLADPHTPYIVKNPALCDTLPGLLATGRFVIDHAYIPIRDLESAAASRVSVGGSEGSVAGGLWGTTDPARQADVLANMFYRLIHTLVVHDIPHTFILFPRMIQDPAYTRGKLDYLLRGTRDEAFVAAFLKVADVSLVHSFGTGEPEIVRAPRPARRPKGLSRFFKAS